MIIRKETTAARTSDSDIPMYQPRVKLEFVRRYCPPGEGWNVFVDIDASEKGQTGGPRTQAVSQERQRKMQRDAALVLKTLRSLRGVTVGGPRGDWNRASGLTLSVGDRDIVAINQNKRCYVIAEVEGESAGQPEQKLYKAIGQIVMAASDCVETGWQRHLILVVSGRAMSRHLQRAKALEELNISALSLTRSIDDDQWLFGKPLQGAHSDAKKTCKSNAAKCDET